MDEIYVPNSTARKPYRTSHHIQLLAEATHKNYLKEGRLLIDNNLAENAVRPIAIGRKNYLFCGNHQAAAHMAIICSLLASCKGAGINPREWLNDVIAKLPCYCRPGKTGNLKELLPAYWSIDKR